MCQTLIFREALCYWKRTLDATLRAYYWADFIVSQQYLYLASWILKCFVCAWCFMWNKTYLIWRLSYLQKKRQHCCLFKQLKTTSVCIHCQCVASLLHREKWCCGGGVGVHLWYLISVSCKQSALVTIIHDCKLSLTFTRDLSNLMFINSFLRKRRTTK